MQAKVTHALRWIGFAFGLAALIYFFSTAAVHFSSLPPIAWGAASCSVFAGAVILQCGVLVLGGYAWCLLLRVYAQPVRTIDGMSVFILAQFARYLPGNVAHFAGRIVLGKSRSMPPAAVAKSLVAEFSWAVITAAAVAAACLGMAGAAPPAALSALLSSGLVALWPAAAIALGLSGAAGFWLWRKLCHGGRIQAGVSQVLVSLASCFCLYVITFFLIGLAADCLAMQVFGAGQSHLVLLTGAFAASWIAGFLAFGAPAGIGVREVVLLELLSPAFGPAVAGGLAMALRASSIAADGLMFLAAYAMVRNKGFFSGGVPGKSEKSAQ